MTGICEWPKLSCSDASCHSSIRDHGPTGLPFILSIPAIILVGILVVPSRGWRWCRAGIAGIRVWVATSALNGLIQRSPTALFEQCLAEHGAHVLFVGATMLLRGPASLAHPWFFSACHQHDTCEALWHLWRLGPLQEHLGPT